MKGICMKKTLKIISIILAIILIDQLVKGYFLYLVTNDIPLYGSAWRLVPFPYLISHVTDFFNIVFTWNPGTSFSLFRSMGESAPILIIVMTSIIIGFISYYLFNNSKSNEKLPLALIVGGALGNLVDRLRFGAVIDFLDFHAGSFHWPAFNVADICITVGIGLYLLNLIIKGKK